MSGQSLNSKSLYSSWETAYVPEKVRPRVRRRVHVLNARLCVREVNRGRLGRSERGRGFIVAVGLLAFEEGQRSSLTYTSLLSLSKSTLTQETTTWPKPR